MRKPNFFIIGAPKCGTTSLAAYLADHPNVYMSPIKEPHFFNTDMRWHDINVPDKSAYMRLFSDATSAHLAVGEASTTYLFSRQAVPNILEFNSESKFIVMIRNPVDLAYALHSELLWNHNEDVQDFAEAWQLQDARVRGEHLPRTCLLPEWLQYRDVCKIGGQLDRVYSHVPRERVHVISQDALAREPRQVYLGVLQFLGLDDDGKRHFTVHNQSKRARWQYIANIVDTVCRIKHKVETHIGFKTRFGLLAQVQRLNKKPHRRTPLSPALKAQLVSEFRDDVEFLSKIVGQPHLVNWLTQHGTPHDEPG